MYSKNIVQHYYTSLIVQPYQPSNDEWVFYTDAVIYIMVIQLLRLVTSPVEVSAGNNFPFSNIHNGTIHYTVNSLYRGHCRDSALVSSLARVHNSGSFFQSNVCNLFLPGIWLLSVLSGFP